MANIAPSYVTVNPSYTMPETLLPYSQASGAFDTLAGGEPMVRLSEGDLYVYINRIDVRTKVSAGQTAYNSLPSCSVVMSQISTPSYLLRVRAEYDHHDTAAMARRGVSIVEAQRLAMRQGHFQLLRSMLLYGMNPANGEGLLNTNGATSTPLPADTNGDDTVVTYDNGQMGLFLLQTIGAIKTRTNNLGIGHEFTILAPQRILQSWEYNVVQLVQYQRPGAGTESTAGMVKLVAETIDDDIKWVADDTLIGKGSGGHDLIVFTMPELEVPDSQNEINTNEFAKITPGFLDNTVMYTDMVAPREITTPIPNGAVHVMAENRISAGWGVRPEAITLLSAQYQ